MKTRLLLTIIVLIQLISCKKEEQKNNGIEITMGSICGWCAGGDSIIITQENIKYASFNFCDTNSFIRDTSTNINEWNKLIKLLDYNVFQNISIYTCYYCADGCDTWVDIKNSTNSHRIRYGYNDSLAIQNIRPFVDKLDSIRFRFKR